MTILLIEDDERILEFLQRGLQAEGYNVRVARDGLNGLEMARADDLRLVLLDLMLPRMDGREVCRTLRGEGRLVPIMMVTALDSTKDVVRGLRFGADDYITKPFAFDEFLARVEALLRRGPVKQVRPGILRVADLEFDRDALVVRRAGHEIGMTSLEYALLEFLMLESDKVVSRARILENVWGTTNDPLTNVVDVYIRRLRAHIDQGYAFDLIKTVRGRGYRLSG